MTLEQIVNSDKALNVLLTKELPFKISYKISKIASNLLPELKYFEEQKLIIIKSIGEATDKPGEVEVKQDKMALFNEKIGKLLETEVPLEFGPDKSLDKIKVEELEQLSIEPRYLVYLDWLISDV